MKTTRAFTLSALLSLATLLAAPNGSLRGAELREEFHQTYPLDKQGKVQLENVNGNVHIVTWDREEIKVDAVKHAKKQADLDAVKIDVDAQSDRIRIRTKYPDSRNRKNDSAGVDYTLTVPAKSRLDKVSTVNGGIEIEGVGGDVAASSVNGTVAASGLAGGVDLSTVNGSVKANFASLDKAISLKSVNGAVSVALPPETNADVSAHTLNGGINNAFSMPVKKHFPVGQNLDSKLGRGGPEIELSTVNGGIHIDRIP